MILDMTALSRSHLSFGHLDRAPVLRSGVALHVKAPLHNAAVVPLAVDHVGMLQRCNPPIIPLPEYLSAVSPRNRVHRVLQIAGASLHRSSGEEGPRCCNRVVPTFKGNNR